MSRKQFSPGCVALILLLSAGFATAESAVDLQKPPERLPADFPKLSLLLRTYEGKPITTKADWGAVEKDMLATIDIGKLLAVERATVEKPG